MRIATDDVQGIRVLSCDGALTIGAAAEEFEVACKRAVGSAAGRLILDLTRLTYLDSAGVGSIVACSKRAAERGTVVKIALAPGGAVRRVFAVTQLDQAFEIFDGAAAAAESFR